MAGVRWPGWLAGACKWCRGRCVCVCGGDELRGCRGAEAPVAEVLRAGEDRKTKDGRAGQGETQRRAGSGCMGIGAPPGRIFDSPE